MSEFNSGKPKPWNIYGSSYPSPSQTEVGREGPWNSFGTSSMNAISFGFVATAILISMFLIMAIFEHLFRPNAPFSSSPDDSTAHLESLQIQKLGDSQTVQASYASDFSVVMPGQQYPTFIAQPAPLPCPREGAVYWHSHQHP